MFWTIVVDKNGRSSEFHFLSPPKAKIAYEKLKGEPNVPGGSVVEIELENAGLATVDMLGVDALILAPSFDKEHYERLLAEKEALENGKS